MKTKCEICGTKHKWDSCQDYYPTCTEVEIRTESPRNILVTLYFCSCCNVIATLVLDREHGGTVYVPCLEEL